MYIVKVKRWSDVIDEWVLLAEAVGEDKETLNDYALGFIDADAEQHQMLYSPGRDYYTEVRNITVVE